MAYRFYKLKKNFTGDWEDTEARNSFLKENGLTSEQISGLEIFDSENKSYRADVLFNTYIHEWIIDNNNFGKTFEVKKQMITKRSGSYERIETDVELTLELKKRFLDDIEVGKNEKEGFSRYLRLEELEEHMSDIERFKDEDVDKMFILQGDPENNTIKFFNLLRKLVEAGKIYLADKESCVIWRADDVIGYNDGFLITHPR